MSRTLNREPTVEEIAKVLGSTKEDVAEALERDHKIVVDRRKITIAEPIKAYVNYTLTTKLYTDVVGKINVLVCSN